MDPITHTNEPPRADERPPLHHVEEALRGLRFGTVIVTVQDGVVVQVERTERKRLIPPGRKN